MCVSISLYLSLYLSISLSLYLSISISLYLSISLSDSLSLYLSISLSISLSLYLSVSLYLYLSVSLSLSDPYLIFSKVFHLFSDTGLLDFTFKLLLASDNSAVDAVTTYDTTTIFKGVLTVINNGFAKKVFDVHFKKVQVSNNNETKNPYTIITNG